MSFLDIKFPESIRPGFVGGPVFKTDSVPGCTPDKTIYRAAWTAPAYEYTADIQRFDDNIAELLAFFRIVKGAYHSFRFKDWIDYRAIAVEIGVGDGVQQAFQLVKKYSVGAFDDVRIITKPVAATVFVEIDSVPTTSYVLDASTGILTFNTAPALASVITASFEFDVQVRFSSDSLQVAKNNPVAFDSSVRLVEAFD